MVLLIHSKTSATQPLKYENGLLISSNTLPGMWLHVHAGSKHGVTPLTLYALVLRRHETEVTMHDVKTKQWHLYCQGLDVLPDGMIENYRRKIAFVCLYITPSHYHHCAKTWGRVFSVYPFPSDDWENIYVLSYYHHQIGSMNYYPLFRVRSWNNGVRCMSFCILLNTLYLR